MSVELKPCPVCSAPPLEPEKIRGGGSSMPWAIACHQYCVVVHGCTKAEVLRRWNTRPIEDALAARVAELEAALRKVDGEVRKIDANLLIATDRIHAQIRETLEAK